MRTVGCDCAPHESNTVNASWKRTGGIFGISLATLAFEIILTRVFAVAQWYHFAFLSVSVALLGFGASGSLLALLAPGLAGARWRKLLLICAFLFPASILGSYLLANYSPFDSYRIAWEPVQFLYLAGYYLALTCPFFLSGLIVGASLSLEPSRAHAVYASNLLGSAAGGAAAWGFLPLLGGSGAVVAAAICGLAGAMAFTWPDLKQSWTRTLPGVSALALAMLGICAALRPAFLEIRMSPYKPLSQALRVPGARLTFTGWNAFSRVDVVESPTIRSAPGQSLTYPGALPPQAGLLVDGDNLQPITRRQATERLDFTAYLPMAAPYRLIPGGKALVIGPGGGLEVLVALEGGARAVTAVEANPLVAHVLRDIYGEYNGHLYDDPRVRLAMEEGRTYLRRSRETFDIIHLALSDTYRPVTSGAYSLTESYLYTQEAFVEALRHLAPQGILAATRWLQYPPSEGLRLGALAVESLAALGIESPATHLLAFRSWSTLTVLAKRQPFSADEVARLRAFCTEKQFDLVHYPEMTRDEANRHHVYATPIYYDAFHALLTADDRRDFYRDYAYDISPPTDNRPFFFHFFKWQQVPSALRLLGKTWQPFGGSGYLMLLLLLALAAIASALLILLPLWARGRVSDLPRRGRAFVYFAGLGLGYLFVELPLVQRFILFLGQPTYAFTAVLSALLLFSGVGSSLAPRIPQRIGLPALVSLALLYPAFLPHLFNVFLPYPLAARLLVTAVALAPLGLLMGLPFAQGLRVASQLSPQLIPWAWGINGCASVVASILATLLALSWGFTAVLAAGAAAYALACVAFWPLTAKRPRLTAQA